MNVTFTLAAPATTCQLVTTCPLPSQTMPEPAPAGASWMFSVNTSLLCATLVMYTTEGVFFWNRLIVACSSAVRYREGFFGWDAGTGLMYVCVGSIADAGGTKSPPSADARSAPAASNATGRDSTAECVSSASSSARRDARHATRARVPRTSDVLAEAGRVGVTSTRERNARVDARGRATVACARVEVVARIVPFRGENPGSGRTCPSM